MDDSASGCTLRKAGRQVIPVAAHVTSAEHRRRHVAEIAHKARVSNSTDHDCSQSSDAEGPVHCVHEPRRAGPLRRQWLHRQSHLLRRRDFAELVRLLSSSQECKVKALSRTTDTWLNSIQPTLSVHLSCTREFSLVS